MPTVGFNLFKSISRAFSGLKHTFGKMFDHVVAFALETVGPLVGIPPGVAGPLAELVLHALAGDRKAKAAVHHASLSDPKKKAFILHVAAHAKGHPDFGAFREHGKAIARTVHPPPPPARTHGHDVVRPPPPPARHAKQVHVRVRPLTPEQKEELARRAAARRHPL